MGRQPDVTLEKAGELQVVLFLDTPAAFFVYVHHPDTSIA